MVSFFTHSIYMLSTCFTTMSLGDTFGKINKQVPRNSKTINIFFILSGLFKLLIRYHKNLLDQTIPFSSTEK